jgi:putative endonuclease
MKRGGSVYILTNISNDVYIGVTANLFFRLKEHKDKKYTESFTAKYNCIKLVYYENFTTIDEAIAREKQLKNWHRLWKENLIMSVNLLGHFQAGSCYSFSKISTVL